MTQPSTFTRELRRAATDALGAGPVRIDDVVAEAIEAHRDLFRSEGEHLATKAARRIVKDVLRRLGEDDGADELTLPDMPLPSVIYVEPAVGEPYYRRTDLATWAEVQAGLAERERNVDRARQKLQEYRDGMAALAPAMAGRPDLTVGDAVRAMLAKPEAA